MSRTAAATAANQRYAVERHASDPVKLGWAVRVVQAALERRTLNMTDLLPAGVQTRSLPQGDGR